MGLDLLLEASLGLGKRLNLCSARFLFIYVANKAQFFKCNLQINLHLTSSIVSLYVANKAQFFKCNLQINLHLTSSIENEIGVGEV